MGDSPDYNYVRYLFVSIDEERGNLWGTLEDTTPLQTGRLVKDTRDICKQWTFI